MEEVNNLDLGDNKKMNFDFPMNVQTNNKAESLCDIEKLSQPQTNAELWSNDKSNESITSLNSNIFLITNNKNLNNNFNLKILTKYKEIYVPKIFLLDYNDTSKYPPQNLNCDNVSLSQNLNFNKCPFSFYNFNNNNNNNNTCKEYLNYGYNFEQWKEYVNKIRNKFDELNEYVIKGKIRLPEPYNELEYLFALPSDYGGLGYIYNEHKYKNVKFYDPKIPENKDKKFMKQVRIERKMTWFPLQPNPVPIFPKISFPFYFFYLKNNNKNNKIQENTHRNENENNNNNSNNKEDNKNIDEIIEKSDNEKNKSNNEKEIKNEKNLISNKSQINETIKNEEENHKWTKRSRSRSRDRSNSKHRKNEKKYYDSKNNRRLIKYNNIYNNKYYKNNYSNKYKKTNSYLKKSYYNDYY